MSSAEIFANEKERLNTKTVVPAPWSCPQPCILLLNEYLGTKLGSRDKVGLIQRIVPLFDSKAQRHDAQDFQLSHFFGAVH